MRPSRFERPAVKFVTLMDRSFFGKMILTFRTLGRKSLVMSLPKSISAKPAFPKTLSLLKKTLFLAGYGGIRQHQIQPSGVSVLLVKSLTVLPGLGLIGDGKGDTLTQKRMPKLFLTKCGICYAFKWRHRILPNGLIRGSTGLMGLMAPLKVIFMSILRQGN